MNEIEKFDPSKLMDGVRDRIKATFVSLIPDEMWDAMVEKEIYIFTEGRIEIKQEFNCETKQYDLKEVRTPYTMGKLKDQWGHKTAEDDISPLQQMIRNELRNDFQKRLKDYLRSEEYQNTYDQYGKPQMAEAVKKIVVENSDSIFSIFMGNIVQHAIQQLSYQIATNQNNY